MTFTLSYFADMGKIWVGLFVLLLISGCGAGSLLGGDDSPSFSSSAAIQTALDDAGLPCTGYETVLKADREWGMESASDVGKCEVDGENVKMVIWKDEGQKENWTGMSKQLGCTMGKAFGVMNFDYVAGGTWTVSDTSQTLSKQIADAIGGRAIHVDCKDVEIPSG